MATKKSAKTVAMETTTKAMNDRIAKAGLQENPAKEQELKAVEKAIKDAMAWAKTDTCPEMVKDFITGAETYIEQLTTKIRTIWGIEAGLMQIADLVNAHNIAESELSAELETLKKDAMANLQSLAEEFESKKIQFEEEFKNMQEDYERKDQREKRIKDEAWEEKATAKQKELDARVKAVEEQEERIRKIEAEDAELKAKIEAFPEELKAAVTKAEGKISGIVKAQADAEAKLVATKHEAEVEKLTFQIGILEERCRNLENDKETLQKEAKEANERLAGVAKDFANAKQSTVNVTTTGK